MSWALITFIAVFLLGLGTYIIWINRPDGNEAGELLCINCDVCHIPLTKRREVRGLLVCDVHARQASVIPSGDLRSIARGTCPQCDINQMMNEALRRLNNPYVKYLPDKCPMHR